MLYNDFGGAQPAAVSGPFSEQDLRIGSDAPRPSSADYSIGPTWRFRRRLRRAS
jgi:hypothetical protein